VVAVGGAAAFAAAPGEGARPRLLLLDGLWSAAGGGGGAWARGRRLYWPADTPFGTLVVPPCAQQRGGGGGGGPPAGVVFDSAHAEERVALAASTGPVAVSFAGCGGRPRLPPRRAAAAPPSPPPDYVVSFFYDHATDTLRPL
jgi:hypothetical protein